MAAVTCSVKGVFVVPGPAGTVPLVLLADGTGRLLPIFIGFFEAVSIRSALDGEVPPRPFTHDLFMETFAKFNIRITSLQIDSIQDGVYYAQLILAADHREVRVDCRPSDGIALAIRGKAPIYVEQDVLDSAGQDSGSLPPLMDLGTFVKQ
jgi:bifunctional DNase/RNase